MQNRFDPYIAGAKLVNDFDPYEAGAKVIDDNQKNNFINQLSSGSENQLVDPTAFLKIALSNYSPMTTIQEIAPTFGKLISPINPELMSGNTIGSGLVNMLGRVGMGTLSSTSQQLPQINNSSDLVNAVEKNALLNSALEIPTLPFRGASFVAEKMNPIKFTENMATEIKNNYDDLKEKEDNLYNPVMNQYGDLPINYDSYKNTLEDNKQFFTPDINLLNKQFIKEPTLQNAHRLQSIMGDNSRNLSLEKSINLDKVQAINNSQAALQSDLINSLYSKDPIAANMYNEGAALHATQVSPYKSNPTLYKIIQGDTDVSPNNLQKALTDVKKDNDIDSNHYLKLASNELDNKLNFGKALQSGIPVGVGGLGLVAGHYGLPIMFPGVGNALSSGVGLGTGLGLAYAAKYAEPGFINLAQNPWIRNSSSIASNFYYPLGRNLIGNSQ